MSPDFTRFKLRIPVKAAETDIYDCWTTQAGLERWFLRKAPFTTSDKTTRRRDQHAAANDTYEWRWYGWNDDVAEHGSVLEANGKSFFKFIFGKAGTVSISIKEEHGQTICELIQENIPTDGESMGNYFIGCQTGWTFYLTNLKSVLEGGPDLRNRDENLKNVVNS